MTYLHFMQPVSGDRGYTSIAVAVALAKNKLTYVGTMQANRKGIPAELKEFDGREAESTLVRYTSSRSPGPPMSLTAYCKKLAPKRMIHALSTFHVKEMVSIYTMEHIM